jgi:hypothetical protein
MELELVWCGVVGIVSEEVWNDDGGQKLVDSQKYLCVRSCDCSSLMIFKYSKVSST